MSLDPGALYALKAGVLEEVRSRLAATEEGEPGRVCVVPGAEVAWDECECGQLTVHHRNVYPSKHFPTAYEEKPWTKCEPGLWVVELVVTVVRCAPDPGPDDTPPSCESLDKTARIQDTDVEAMQLGVLCAVAGTFHQMLNHVTVGPGGLCVGSALTVLVGLPNCPTVC